ncbi:MAG TPA: Hpt domain-containing protein [Vicinamibacterales bacterium]|nr:Hpt domain-containing protein [Vicinamibacterales bacterium]
MAQLLQPQESVTDELRELQRDYLADVRQAIERVREHARGLSDQEQFKAAFPELLFLAHQLKGSGGSLGFPAITEVAQKLRNELTSFLDPVRPTPEELSQHVVALSRELERAVDSAACRDD